MSVAELNEEIEATIAAHDLEDGHAARVRELVQEGVPVLDAIRQASSEEPRGDESEPSTGDPAAGLDGPTPEMLKALAKENERHVKAVRKAMGSFVEGFVDCHECDGLGLEAPAPKPKPHPFYATCGTCNGYGQVLTGSLDDAHRGITCPDCAGRGFLELLLDNTPAAELVKQWREQRAAQATAPIVPAAPPIPAPPGSDVTMGHPAWMGDPNLTT